jgi:hypothetical protein
VYVLTGPDVGTTAPAGEHLCPSGSETAISVVVPHTDTQTQLIITSTIHAYPQRRQAIRSSPLVALDRLSNPWGTRSLARFPLHLLRSAAAAAATAAAKLPPRP